MYSACTAGARLRVARLTSLLALCELASLLLVTVVPSVELYSLHILATGAFLVTSGLHMALSCHLVRSHTAVKYNFYNFSLYSKYSMYKVFACPID